MPAKRLFVAISVPSEIRTALAAYKNTLAIPGLSWVKEENLHITLLFLGNTSLEKIPDIGKELSVLSDIPPFTLSCKEIKPVRKRGKLTMLWASFEKSPEFEQLATKVSHVLAHPPDHYPMPHITLARAKKGQPVTAGNSIFPPIDSYQWQVQQVGLWESVLSPGGSVYTVLQEWALKGNQ